MVAGDCPPLNINAMRAISVKSYLKRYFTSDFEFTLWTISNPLVTNLHTAEKHRPTMFHTATVRPRRSGPKILYNTPLNVNIVTRLRFPLYTHLNVEQYTYQYSCMVDIST